MGKGGDSGDSGGGEVACKKLQNWKMCVRFSLSKLATPPQKKKNHKV